MYLTAAEYVSSQKSKGEVLLFRRGQVPKITNQRDDEEGKADDRPTAQDMIELQKTKSEVPPNIQRQTAIFHWAAVNYDIKVKGGERRLLDDVDGWVKPGTLTAVSSLDVSLNCSYSLKLFACGILEIFASSLSPCSSDPADLIHSMYRLD